MSKVAPSNNELINEKRAHFIVNEIEYKYICFWINMELGFLKKIKKNNCLNRH